MNAQDTSKHSTSASVRGSGGRKTIAGWEHMGEIAAVFESNVELTSSITPRTTINEQSVGEHQGDKQQGYPVATRAKHGDNSPLSQYDTEPSILSSYSVNDNNNAVSRSQRNRGSNYEGIIRSASVVEESKLRSKDTSTTLTMTSSSAHAMDLFTSTPRPRTQNAPLTLDVPDFMPAVFEPDTNGGGALDEFENDDLLLRAREAEFTATLQPRSFDASIYATYTDLSSLGALGEIDDYDITYFDDEEESDQRLDNGEDEVQVNGSIGSRESSERGSRTGLDPRPSDSRHLNRSLDSILSDIKRNGRGDDNGFELRLERTRSLENIRLHSGFVSRSIDDGKGDSLPDNQSVSLPDRVGDKETEPDRLTGVLLTVRPESTGEESRVCNSKGERVIDSKNANVETPITATPGSETHSQQSGNALALSTSYTQRLANIHVNSDNYYDEDVSSTRSGAPMEDVLRTVDTEYAGKTLHTASDKNNLPEQHLKQTPSRGEGEKQDGVVAEVESGCIVENMEKKVAGDGAASAEMAEVESLRKEIRAWEEKYGALEKRVRSMDDSGSTTCLTMDPDVENLSLPELQARVTASETMIVDLRDQIECYKEEIEELQLELEEAADRVREGDLEEYRDLKHELDQVTKEWRILQYRLRKADRRVEQADQERQEWEEKCQILMMQMDEMQKQHMKHVGESGGVGGLGSAATTGGRGGGGGSSERVSSAGGSGSEEEDKTVDKEILGLKQELKIAKDVSIRLHQELEMVEEKRARTEEENQLLRKKLVDSEATRKEFKRELEKTRLEVSSTNHIHMLIIINQL
ncbi:uncharacterized protein LOC121429058 [Lytechinus variegatus]|uniref:uncharacterized protein LOC121429058 n=1 Tax=Lytechinus variegatus TaxID=7654 RepID=UPI001BB17ECA|nr:uncharacterized protein LOC121429058 [Lytechinus variegatus]